MKPCIEALLIEDNPSDALLFKSLLHSSEVDGLSLRHIERFSDALKELSAHPFDIVLLDLCLPDGNGVELVRQLRSNMPRLPIVVITGTSDQTVAIAALQEGAQDYLVKSETFSPQRLQQLGPVDIGNLLVKTLRYAIERAELAQELSLSKERYALAVEGAHDGIWDWDLGRNSIYFSPRWSELLGLSAQQLADSPISWMERIHPGDIQLFETALTRHLDRKDAQFQCEYRIRHGDGSYRWMLTRGIAIWDAANKPCRIAGSQTDITERKTLENALHKEKELTQITLHSVEDAVITTDENGCIKDFNPVAERLTGWRAEDAQQMPVSKVCQLIDSQTRQPLANPAMTAITEGEITSISKHPTLVSKTGEEFAIGDSAAPIRSTDGDILGTVLVFHDVTEERGRALQLTWQATHDPLTKLFNRQKFLSATDAAIADSKRVQAHHVLCCLDLDHFKVINDTCGHAAGDELLQQITTLWQGQIRGTDILARLGGDEFGLLLYDCNINRAVTIADELCALTQNYRFVYQGHVFRVGVSIGLVAIGEHITDLQEALKLADSACYSAKNKGRNRSQVCSPNDDNIAQQSADSQWFARLTEALEKDLFCLYQQPIADTQNPENGPCFCEILLRLSSENTAEPLLPMAFLPPAERYHLMPRIDRWVVRHFFAYLADNPGLSDTLYTINLSGASINDSEFIDFIMNQLDEFAIDPAQICFEITETVAISNLQNAGDFVLSLKELGCKFALDDFGSGMSSFAYLRHLSVDYLKIDGNFVRESPDDHIVCAMLEAINQVGHVVGLKTIAEYVENSTILEQVRKIGIDFVQGYKIGRPQPLIETA